MKKWSVLVLSVAMALSLCACGGGGKAPAEEPVEVTDRAVIVTNQGKTVALTAQELMDLFDEDEAAFYNIYGGAQVTFEGTVRSVATKVNVFNVDGKFSTEQEKLVFEEGWCLAVSAHNEDICVTDYEPGQRLRVTSCILNAKYNTDFVKEQCDYFRVVWLVGDDTFWDQPQYSKPSLVKVLKEE